MDSINWVYLQLEVQWIVLLLTHEITEVFRFLPFRYYGVVMFTAMSSTRNYELYIILLKNKYKLIYTTKLITLQRLKGKKVTMFYLNGEMYPNICLAYSLSDPPDFYSRKKRNRFMRDLWKSISIFSFAVYRILKFQVK